MFFNHFYWLIKEISSIDHNIQGRSQNFEKVPQNFTEVSNVDDVTANDVIQKNQYRKEKKP